MDESILRWSQSAEAQPYLQKVTMGSQGQSYGGGMDQYGSYLTQLIDANQNNPSLQKELLGYYLDYSNPQNQQVDEENQLNTALSLLSSEDPAMQEWGKMLIQQSYPQLTQTGYGGTSSYEDVLRKEASGVIADPTGLSREEFEWQNYLANQATPEQIGAYDMAKPKLSELDREDIDIWGNALAGGGGGAAIGAGVGSVVPVLGTGIGALAGGAIGTVAGTIRTLIQLSKAKEEARRRAAGYSGYSL